MGRTVIDDLRHLPPSDDPFVILSGDACVLILCAIIAACILFPELARI
jgi:hypothetical protein